MCVLLCSAESNPRKALRGAVLSTLWGAAETWEDELLIGSESVLCHHAGTCVTASRQQ